MPTTYERPEVPLRDRMAYSVPEAGALAGFGPSKAWEEVKAGRLKTRRLGRRQIVLREELERYLTSLPKGEVIPRKSAAA